MNHLVIFGERPGPNTDPSRPLYPHTTTGAAARLMRLLGMSRTRFLEASRYNVVDDRITSTSDLAARSRVALRMRMHRETHESSRVVFLGRAALNGAPPRYRMLEFGLEMDDVMVIPHPSGVNRYYNSEANTHFIVESLRQFTRGISPTLGL